MQIRLLTSADAEVSLRASRDAFGGPLQDRASFTTGAGVRRWGLFDGNVLAAKANDREYSSLIGGRELATAGVAGVLVAPEYRSRGLAREVMTHLLRQAHDRGAVISTLFRTAPALYRSLGYEQVAELTTARLPTAALRGLRVQTNLRRATAADGPAIRAVYGRLASEGSCLLSRTGPCFTGTDEEMIASFDGITLAVDETGAVVGYVSWNRGSGYGEGAALSVGELHAETAAATQSLLAVVGSFDAVTPTITFRTSGNDPMHWCIPGAGWAVSDVRQYLMRVLDAGRALAARGWPTGLTASVPLSISDPLLTQNSGDFRLLFETGEARLEKARRAGSGGVRIGPRGLAVLLAGDATVASMRRAGLIAGGTAGDAAVLDAAMTGPRPAILDYF